MGFTWEGSGLHRKYQTWVESLFIERQDSYSTIFASLVRWHAGAVSFTWAWAGNTKGESITVPLTSCLTGLDQSVLQIKTKIFSCHTADSKPVKQEVNSTVILPPLVFPELGDVIFAQLVCPLNDVIFCLHQFCCNYKQIIIQGAGQLGKNYITRGQADSTLAPPGQNIKHN